MEIYFWGFLGGIVGAVLMDITETMAAKHGLVSGVTIAFIGRWFCGLWRNQFRHTDIRRSPSQHNEVKMGWIVHFIAGGGGVALLFPLFFHATGIPYPNQLVFSGILFGLITSLLPWLILLPAFGWGFFGVRGPQGSNALIASMLSHIPYGLGVVVMIAVGRHI